VLCRGPTVRQKNLQAHLSFAERGKKKGERERRTHIRGEEKKNHKRGKRTTQGRKHPIHTEPQIKLERDGRTRGRPQGGGVKRQKTKMNVLWKKDTLQRKKGKKRSGNLTERQKKERAVELARWLVRGK